MFRRIYPVLLVNSFNIIEKYYRNFPGILMDQPTTVIDKTMNRKMIITSTINAFEYQLKDASNIGVFNPCPALSYVVAYNSQIHSVYFFYFDQIRAAIRHFYRKRWLPYLNPI